MYFEGDRFKYYYNGENKTKEEIEQLIDYETTVSIDNFCVNYFSPKKDSDFSSQIITFLDNNEIEYSIDRAPSPEKVDKIQKLLKEVDEHQKHNGILRGIEFPFDADEYTTHYLKALKEQKVVEDWDRKEFYTAPPSKENLERMCENFEKRVKKSKSFAERVEEDLDKCRTGGKKETGERSMSSKFAESGARAGQKHNSLKAPLDILQTRQFPKALQLLALATAYGNHKYKSTDSDFLNFKRVDGGSQAYLDAQSRHATDRNNFDSESGLHHIIHSIWNGMAALELWAEENKINIEEYSKNYLKSLVVSK